MNARDIPPELELLEALEALEALGLVDVEVNDLGELRVSPTRAAIAAVDDGYRHCPRCESRVPPGGPCLECGEEEEAIFVAVDEPRAIVEG